MKTQYTQTVPAWVVRHLGQLVEVSQSIDGHPAGSRGVLLSISTKKRWGEPGIYCTVALNLADMTDESNVELSWLRRPVLIGPGRV